MLVDFSYPLRDISSPVRGQYRDMETALQAWYLMCEFRALADFGRRWRNQDDRRELWRDLVEFWGFGEVYGDDPLAIAPSAGGQNSWHPWS